MLGKDPRARATVIGAVIGAVALVVVALIERPWNSKPPAERPAETVVQPSPEPPTEGEPISSAPMLPAREPIHFESCESIDRSRQDVFSRSMFDLRQTLIDMDSTELTDLEIANYLVQYDGLRAIDCGYVKNVYRNGNKISVSLTKVPDERVDFTAIFCEFDESWQSKIVSLDRAKQVALEGIIDARDSESDVLELKDCRILEVE